MRDIARITGRDFRTVKKYACREDWNEEKEPGIEPQRFPVLGAYIPIIDKWIEQDRKVPKNQRHIAKRIFDRLREEYGYHLPLASARSLI